VADDRVFKWLVKRTLPDLRAGTSGILVAWVIGLYTEYGQHIGFHQLLAGAGALHVSCFGAAIREFHGSWFDRRSGLGSWADFCSFSKIYIGILFAV